MTAKDCGKQSHGAPPVLVHRDREESDVILSQIMVLYRDVRPMITCDVTSSKRVVRGQTDPMSIREGQKHQQWGYISLAIYFYFMATVKWLILHLEHD